MQRRVFLKSGALALVTMGLNPSFLQRAAFAADLRGAGRRRTLICLFQRGAADALNVVVPYGERAYHALRPSIGIASPSVRAGAEGALDLDGFFGLHPAHGRATRPHLGHGRAMRTPRTSRAPRGSD
jgi:uncharacterized protein (DUF1501 family)